MRGEESVWLAFTVLYPLRKKSLNSERASNIKIISGKKKKTALLYNEDIKGDKTSLEHSLSSKASPRICEFCLKQWRESLCLSMRLFQNGLLLQIRFTSITTKRALSSFWLRNKPVMFLNSGKHCLLRLPQLASVFDVSVFISLFFFLFFFLLFILIHPCTFRNI